MNWRMWVLLQKSRAFIANRWQLWGCQNQRVGIIRNGHEMMTVANSQWKRFIQFKQDLLEIIEWRKESRKYFVNGYRTNTWIVQLFNIKVNHQVQWCQRCEIEEK